MAEVENQESIDTWIKKRNGTCLKSVKTSKPVCVKCNQPIYEKELRNYDGEAGRRKAILDILDSNKPMYAKAIANNIVKIPKNEFPKKIVELFDLIKLEVRIK